MKETKFKREDNGRRILSLDIETPDGKTVTYVNRSI